MSNNKAAKKDRDSSDDNSDNGERIRVGREFQAPMLPPKVTEAVEEDAALNEKAVLVWKPSADIPDEVLENYIKVAKEKHGYNGEQALGMLFWHSYDVERALMDLTNFSPQVDEWTLEDQVLFEQAFQFHGKSFNRIRQMLPDKSVASLVKYYYSWKKTRQKTSVMDVQERQAKTASSDNSAAETSDTEEKVIPPAATLPAAASAASVSLEEKPTSSLLLECAGCGVACSEVSGTVHGKLCQSCYQHFRNTGSLRPTAGPSCMSKRYRPNGGNEKHKRHPPRGIYINHDDIVTLASASQSETKQPANNILVGMEREVASHRSTIQKNLQRLSGLQTQNQAQIEGLEPKPESSNRIAMRWNNEENELVVQGVRLHGKDFATIATILGSKTEAQIKTFFVNYRRRYNLDQLVRDHEATLGPPKKSTELLEIDLDEENTNTNSIVEEVSPQKEKTA